MSTITENVSSWAEKKLTSHDYANNLQKMAEFLLSRDSFPLPDYQDAMPWQFFRFYDHEKNAFIAAAKALGSGKKKFTEADIEFTVVLPFGKVELAIPRSTFCRLVRAAEYECDPILSAEELAGIDGAA